MCCFWCWGLSSHLVNLFLVTWIFKFHQYTCIWVCITNVTLSEFWHFRHTPWIFVTITNLHETNQNGTNNWKESQWENVLTADGGIRGPHGIYRTRSVAQDRQGSSMGRRKLWKHVNVKSVLRKAKVLPTWTLTLLCSVRLHHYNCSIDQRFLGLQRLQGS